MTGLNPHDFRDRVVNPTLRTLDLWSPAAERLVFLTAIHESGLRSLLQRGGGPARGVYQIEPATMADVIERTQKKYPRLWSRAELFLAPAPSLDDQLVTNLAWATVICRLKYYLVPESLPYAGDRSALAAYWGKWYQTESDPVKIAAFLSDTLNLA